MASENNNFQSTVNSLFKGMDSFITTKTVVGDAITVGDTIILPLVDVTFGVAATAKNEDKKQNGGGGMGGKMSPSAVLVIQNGTTKLVNVKNQDGLTKILDMVPDFVNKFTDGKFFSSKDDDEIISEAKEEKESRKRSQKVMGIGQFRKIHDLLCYDAFADAYSGNKEIRRNPMKRIIGYTVFWIAFGMTIAFFMPNVFVSVLFIFGLLLLGYFMFCC